MTLGFSEQSKEAAIMGRLYDKLRRAELQRNTWSFAIRTAALRPIAPTTMLLAPAMWVADTTYFRGSLVSDETGTIWISAIPNNLGNQPEGSSTWQEYFGPLTVQPWATGGTTTAYYAGELVYTAAGDGTYRVYLSLQSGNTDNPATATAWGAATTYSMNQVTTFNSVAYMSLVDLNTGRQPDVSPAQWTTVFVGGAGSLQWLQIGGAEFPMGVALVTPSIIYPLGAGPSTQSTTRNVFRLPAGFLSEAPQDPKAGSVSWLGAPTNRQYDDWNFQDEYIVSGCSQVIVLRFVADTVDVATFHDMFCEGLGARMGMEACEPLTQSGEKLSKIGGLYKQFMGDARTRNAILTGSEEPPLDDYLACRL